MKFFEKERAFFGKIAIATGESYSAAVQVIQAISRPLGDSEAVSLVSLRRCPVLLLVKL